MASCKLAFKRRLHHFQYISWELCIIFFSFFLVQMLRCGWLEDNSVQCVTLRYSVTNCFLWCFAWFSGIYWSKWRRRLYLYHSCQSPKLQILRIDMELREETIDHVIINVQRMTSCATNHHKFEMAQNTWKRCCWHSNIWPDWFTSHKSHYYQVTMAFTMWFIRKYSVLTLK